MFQVAKPPVVLEIQDIYFSSRKSNEQAHMVYDSPHLQDFFISFSPVPKKGGKKEKKSPTPSFSMELSSELVVASVPYCSSLE